MSENDLTPSKSDILEFCDRTLAKWSKDGNANSKNILALNAVKTSVVWTDEATLGALWGEITQWMHEILYEDVMTRVRKESSKRSATKRTRTRAKSQ